MGVFGGPDKPINVYDHCAPNGSREFLSRLLLDMDETEMRNGSYNVSMVAPGMMEAGKMVAQNPWGLTYSLYTWERFASAENLGSKMLKLDGVAPNRENIASKKYPLFTPIYIVVRKDADPGSRAVKLRDWLLSEDGQRLVVECGYMPAAVRR